jgi:DNA-binding MarR family transcriptional regulator
LTARGRSLVPQLSALADDNDAEFFRPLSVEERRVLKRLLERLVEQNELKVVPVD